MKISKDALWKGIIENLIDDFIAYFVPFTNSEISTNFEQDLITITNSTIPMGLREAILEDVKRQGIEQGIATEKSEFTKKLWELQEFSLEKIAILVDLPEEQVCEIILALLQANGQTIEEAEQQIKTYQTKFVI